MGKVRGLSVAERANSVALNEERYSERGISKKLKFSKIAIHQAIGNFKLWEFSGLAQVRKTQGYLPQRCPSNKMDGSAFTYQSYQFKQKNWVNLVAPVPVPFSNDTNPTFLFKLEGECTTIRVRPKGTF